MGGVNLRLSVVMLNIGALKTQCSPGVSDSKESVCNAGNLRLTPGSGRFPGEGNGNTLQCSFLGNPIDRGAWQARVHGVTKSQTQLSDSNFHFRDSSERYRLAE